MYEIRVFFPYYSAVIVDKSGFLLITSPEISPLRGVAVVFSVWFVNDLIQRFFRKALWRVLKKVNLYGQKG
jgi:hypothetical protein